MKNKTRTFILGLIIGSVVAFPLGINFGRDEPLWSNPFERPDIKDKVVEAVRESTEQAIEGAKETIHDATKPAHEKLD
ncbi:MAG: hypothetical protein ACE5K1_06570 [Acidiferrobacterales bacterium]